MTGQVQEQLMPAPSQLMQSPEVQRMDKEVKPLGEELLKLLLLRDCSDTKVKMISRKNNLCVSHNLSPHGPAFEDINWERTHGLARKHLYILLILILAPSTCGSMLVRRACEVLTVSTPTVISTFPGLSITVGARIFLQVCILWCKTPGL